MTYGTFVDLMADVEKAEHIVEEIRPYGSCLLVIEVNSTASVRAIFDKHIMVKQLKMQLACGA